MKGGKKENEKEKENVLDAENQSSKELISSSYFKDTKFSNSIIWVTH